MLPKPLKVDGSLLVDDPADAGPAAAGLEASGYAGGFTFEGRHDPFLPLAMAARETRELELYSAVAIAFARSPMLLATTAYDLQLLSKGRFILGLGSQIRPHIERRFSMPWSRPVARMREMVAAIRAIWACFEGRAPLDFRGEFYTHTLMTPVFDPGPNPFGPPRIFLAGVGPRMTEAVGEMGDGFLVHPFHTPGFLREATLPALARGLERAGRDRDALEISCQLLVATGDDEEQILAARNGARAQISFYGSTPAYRPVLDHLGQGALQDELRALSKQGRWLEMAGLVDDDLLDAVAVSGPRDTIAERIRARCGDLVDRVSLVAPFAPKGELFPDIVAALRT